MDMKMKGALIVCGVAAVLWIPALSNKPVAGTCEVTAMGLGLLADAIKGQSATCLAVGTVAGGLFSQEKCAAFVKGLEEKPTEPQPVKVTTPSGHVVEDQINRDDLTRDPPERTEASWSRVPIVTAIRCTNSYDTAVLREWCFERKIEPLPEHMDLTG